MKKILLLINFVCFIQLSLIYSQPASDWSDPVLLTDTVSYNSNSNLFINSNDLFYEKKLDSLSPSGIYYQNI